MKFKAILPTFMAVLAAPILLTTVHASQVPSPTPVCTPIFNGGQTCLQADTITINKKVLSPKIAAIKGATFKDSDFVENVTQKDTRYTPNTPTAFRLYVTNTGNKDLKDVLVTDVFPQNFLTFITGAGTFDTKTHTFKTTISSLKKGETKKITIQVLTASSEEIAKNNAPLCTINVATASVDKKTSQDNSMLCVDVEKVAAVASTKPSFPVVNPQQTKGGLPIVSPVAKQQIEKAPSTGAESLVLYALIPTGVLGFILRRRIA